MKTDEKDLSLELQEKINYFKDIVGNHNRGFVIFDGNSFGVQQLNKRNIQKIYNDDEIYALRNHAYKSELNYISAYDNGLVDNKYCRQTLPLMHTIQSANVDVAEDQKIIFHKIIDDSIYIILSNGQLKIVNIKTLSDISEINIGFIISNTLITDSFILESITDIIKYKSGLLISFYDNGIIYISLDKNIPHEIFAPEKYVVRLFTNGSAVFVIKNRFENNVVVLTEKGLKSRVFYQLENSYQQFIDADNTDDSIALLSDTLTYLHSNKVVHLWKLDDGSISWKNMDYDLSINPMTPKNQIKLIRSHKNDNDKLIIDLLIIDEKNKVAFWEYSEGLTILSTDIELSYDDIIDFKVYNDLYYILTKNKMFILNKVSNKMILFYNLYLSKNISRGSIIDMNSFCGFDDKYIMKFSVPEFIIGKEVAINIEKLYGANNADIYIAATDEVVVKLYNTNDDEIAPNFYLKGKNEHFINLINVEKGTKVKIENVPEKSFIYSVVLHKNNIILK